MSRTPSRTPPLGRELVVQQLVEVLAVAGRGPEPRAYERLGDLVQLAVLGPFAQTLAVEQLVHKSELLLESRPHGVPHRAGRRVVGDPEVGLQVSPSSVRRPPHGRSRRRRPRPKRLHKRVERQLRRAGREGAPTTAGVKPRADVAGLPSESGR
jgi:hypothetical protein